MAAYKRKPASKYDACMEIHGQYRFESNGFAFHVTHLRFGFRDVVWLLVHRFLSGSARHDSQKHEGRTAHSHHCGHSQDDDAVDSCVTRRDRYRPDATSAQFRRIQDSDGREWPIKLYDDVAVFDRPLLSKWIVGCGNYCT